MKIAVVDIETTDFLGEGGLIVEIGVAELDLETGETKKLYDELVKELTYGEKHKDSWIYENSNLKHEDVLRAKPLNHEKLQVIFDKYHATAYNKSFDFDFLRSRGLKIKDLPCPMLALTPICQLPGLYGHKWPKVQEAWDYLFPEEAYLEEHRGYDDAEHEAKLVYWLHTQGHVNYGETK